MSANSGKELLEDFTNRAYKKKLWKIRDNIYHFVGYGHSNATIIEADNSLILIDTLDSDERAKKMITDFSKISKKPVKTIIFTHGHPDHRGGANYFKDTVNNIIAFEPVKSELKYSERISKVLMARTVRQFGYNLSDEEAIGQGIGIREGHAVGEGKYDFLSPTEYINKETILDIDGVSIHLAPAPGETDDTGLIWIPEEQVLCIGDNYYACWPNLYALRGGKYRDIAQWIDSLELLLSYDSEVVLPGHTDPLIGKSKVQLVLNNYKESLKEILLQTLDYMNLGYAVDEVIKNVKLPSHLQSLPYMEEFYGTVEWSIKSIYSAYLGWFDGNPTNINKLSKEKYSEKLLSLIENKEKIMSEIVNDNDKEDLLWAMELCDLLLNSKSNNQKEINILKAKIMLKVADYETSANSRHYYIEYAKEILKNEKEIGGNSNGL